MSSPHPPPTETAIRQQLGSQLGPLPDKFWDGVYHALPEPVQRILRKNDEIFLANEYHRQKVAASKAQQTPKIMWLKWCVTIGQHTIHSDSRNPAAVISGHSVGELFEHSNVANCFGDQSTRVGLEYAIEHLHVSHIVVCGHSSCGGVKAVWDHVAAAKGQPMRTDLHDYLKDLFALAEDLVERHGRNHPRFNNNHLAVVHATETAKKIAEFALVSDRNKSYDPAKWISVHALTYDVSEGTLKTVGLPFGRWQQSENHQPDAREYWLRAVPEDLQRNEAVLHHLHGKPTDRSIAEAPDQHHPKRRS